VISLNNNPPDKKDGDDQLLDLSQLDLGNDLTQIDTGVTSGADQTSWDEISVDRDGRVDTCPDSDGKAQSAEKGGAAVCHDTKAQNSDKPGS
jgi:hypothetical protein